MFTRNGKLARFTDDNPNFAQLFQKLINYSYAYANSKKKKTQGLVFECFVNDGDQAAIMVKIKG